MKYYVVSDIHSFYDELISSLQETGYFDDNGEKKLVVCGDLFDRGPKPVEMQNFIGDLLKKDEVILVKGNHDDMMIELLNRFESLVKNNTIARSHYQKNGTVDTLMIMTESTTNEMLSNPKAVVEKMKESIFVKEIYPKMLDYFETEHYLFLHGWLPCKEASEYCEEPWGGENDYHKCNESAWVCSRWYSYLKKDEIEDSFKIEKTIVCGHRSARYGHELENKLLGKDEEQVDFTPFYGDGYIAIDGTTMLSGKVNCLIIED